MPVKPSEKEEEYFARLELQRRKKHEEERQKKIAAEETRRLKELHYMRCPKCGMELSEMDYKGVKVDKCLSCDGNWLDAGELELLLETEQERTRLLNLLIEDSSVKEKSYPCPICSRKMKKVFVGEERKILIDKCKKNHGLWLDKGELKSVIELGSQNSEGADPSGG